MLLGIPSYLVVGHMPDRESAEKILLIDITDA